MAVILVLSSHFSQSVQLLYQGGCPLTYDTLRKLNQVSFIKWDYILLVV